MKSNLLRSFFLSFLLLCVSACGNSTPSSDSSSSNNGDNGNMTYASNWSEIAIDANLAKTRITSTGHFETTRNACSRPAEGAMTLAQWNEFATLMNSALKTNVATSQKVCFEIDPRSCMDGTAQIVNGDGKKEALFEPGEYGQICTRIQDRELAQKLYKLVNSITYAADRSDCTLEYERCAR